MSELGGDALRIAAITFMQLPGQIIRYFVVLECVNFLLWSRGLPPFLDCLICAESMGGVLAQHRPSCPRFEYVTLSLISCGLTCARPTLQRCVLRSLVPVYRRRRKLIP